MNNSFFALTSPLYYMKYAILPALSLSVLNVIASEYQYAIELEDGYPTVFEDSFAKTVDIELNKTFTNIESVCLEGEVENGRPSSATISETSEEIVYINNFPIQVNYLESKAFAYSISIDPSGESIVSELENFTICSSVPENFNDGTATFDLTFIGDNITITSLNLVIDGMLYSTDISSEIADESDAIFSADGGRLSFNTEVTNLDIDYNYKKFKIWSLITFPNGDSYPVQDARELELHYQETKTIETHFLVPSWFDAGEYTLTTYVADKLNGERVSSSFDFTKLTDSEETDQ